MAGTVVTTITKNIVMPGTASVFDSYTITGMQPLGLDAIVTFGAPITVNDGIGVLVKANLQLIYLLSDNLDCTVNLKSATAGGGTSMKQFDLVAGVAQEWDSLSGTNPLSSDVLSIVITPIQTVNGVESILATTAIHLRAQLSA